MRWAYLHFPGRDGPLAMVFDSHSGTTAARMDKYRPRSQGVGMSRCTGLVDRLRRRVGAPTRGLFRRVVLINGLVFTVGTLALAMSPATVSGPVRLTEIPVLVIGMAVVVGANALLLRSSLAPLDRLAASMRRVDLLRRSDRVDDPGEGELHHLIASFNAMLDRLESERASSSALALTAQENERQRIARELHDEIGQTLTVALLTLKRAVDAAPPRSAPSWGRRRRSCGPASTRYAVSRAGCGPTRWKTSACRAPCRRCATNSPRCPTSTSSKTSLPRPSG